MSDNDFFTIYFQGEALPVPMCCVDVAALYDYVPNVPDDTQEWIWRFTICKDCERSANSADIRKHASLLLERITKHRKALIAALLQAGRDAVTTEIFVSAWQQGLERVCDLSDNTETCSWIGGTSV